MNRFGGGFGGGTNMQQLMRQAQKMQEEAVKAKKEIAETEVVGVAQNDLVKVVLSGDKQIISVSIDKRIVDPDDVEMLEDLMVVAFKNAIEKAGTTDKEDLVKAIKASDMDGITGHLTFDEKNNPIKAVTIIKVKDGKYIFDSVVETK